MGIVKSTHRISRLRQMLKKLWPRINQQYAQYGIEFIMRGKGEPWRDEKGREVVD